MAHSITNHHAGIGSFGARFMSGIAEGFRAFVDAKSRRDQIEALDRLSDAQLARRGLVRQDIVRHVFRDMIDR